MSGVEVSIEGLAVEGLVEKVDLRRLAGRPSNADCRLPGERSPASRGEELPDNASPLDSGLSNIVYDDEEDRGGVGYGC